MLFSLGILFLAPVAVRLLGFAARRLPVAPRLALRDLARHSGRTSAALAAISLAIGIVITLVVALTQSEKSAAEGNLGDRQVLVRIGGPKGSALLPTERDPEEVRAAEAALGRIALALGASDTTPLVFAVDPQTPRESGPFGAVRMPMAFAGVRADGDVHVTFENIVYVATPKLLQLYGIDRTRITPGVEVLTSKTVRNGSFVFGPKKFVRGRSLRVDMPAYETLPQTLIMPEALIAHGWVASPSQWLLTMEVRPTDEQRAEAIELAAAAGVEIESRFDQTWIGTTRKIATATGLLLALGVLAMTVGLIRSEGAADLRTLTASGASSRVRRTVTAATAGGLAVFGVVIGLFGAYLGLVAIYQGALDDISRVPVAYLAAIGAGLPVVAFVAGWLLAGGRAPSMVRPAFE